MIDVDIERAAQAAAKRFSETIAAAWEETLAADYQVAVSCFIAYAGLLERANAQQLAYIQKLEAENAALRAAYTRQTQLALAAGLVRFVMTGDRP